MRGRYSITSHSKKLIFYLVIISSSCKFNTSINDEYQQRANHNQKITLQNIDIPLDEAPQSCTNHSKEIEIFPQDIEILRYIKCYKTLVNETPSNDDKVIQKLKNSNPKDQKSISLKGCRQLLDRSELIKDRDRYIINPKDPIAEKIFNNLHKFHQSWVKYNNPYLDPEYQATGDFFEVHETSLRLTRALFSTDWDYDQILSGNDNLIAIRQQKQSTDHSKAKYSLNSYLANLNIKHPKDPDLIRAYLIAREFGIEKIEEKNVVSDTQKYFATTVMPWMKDPHLFTGEGENENSVLEFNQDVDDIEKFNEDCVPRPLDRGKMIGITTQKSECIIKNIFNKHRHRVQFRDNGYNFYQSAGGGAIGTTSYISSAEKNTVTKDHIQNNAFNRKWAESLLNDFLCRTIPTINHNISPGIPEDEIIMDVSKIPEDHTYRLNGKCLDCHLSIDNISASLRNYQLNSFSTRSKDNTLIINEKQSPSQYTISYNKESADQSPVEYRPHVKGSYFLMENIPDQDYLIFNKIENEFIFDSDIGLIFNKKIYPDGQDLLHKTRRFKLDYPTSPINNYASGRTWFTFFNRSIPAASFYHDDIEGNRVGGSSVSFIGVDELGEILTSTVDFYACAAKKYFFFLTNYNVQLFSDYSYEKGGNDLTNPLRFGERSNEDDLKRFDFIKNLGKNFHQKSSIKDMKDLMIEIISSDYFIEQYKTKINKKDSIVCDQVENNIQEDSSSSVEVSSFEKLTNKSISILQKNCTSCHSNIDDNFKSCFDESECSENKYFQVTRDPCDSKTFKSLKGATIFSNGYCKQPIESGTMPKNGPPLNEDELETIFSWIKEASKNNERGKR